MVQVVLTGHSRYCILCMVCIVCICTRGSECKWFEVHRWYSCRDMAITRSHMVVLVVQYNLHKICASLGWVGMVQVVLTGHSQYCIMCMLCIVCMVCIWTRGSECKCFEVHRWYS